MAFRNMVLGATSASVVLVAVAAGLPALMVSPATSQAQTSVSISIGTGVFYDRLAPYGSWVSYEDQYVFVPRDVDSDWRPYTRGHWIYTRHYGWLWVTNERFGWATYHYGRWGYGRDIGWYWVPGSRWAPAWVAWSHGQDEIAWAPLPPGNGDEFGINVTFGQVPDYYWQAVPVAAFLSINISDRVIRDRNQVRDVVQQGRPEAVRIENNTVINNVIPVNTVELATHTKVQVLDEKPVAAPDASGKSDANTIGIFNPEIKPDATAKPLVPVPIDQVVSGRKARGLQPLDEPNGKVTPPAPDSGSSTQMPSPKGQPPVVPLVPKSTSNTNAVNTAPQDATAPVLVKPLDTGKVQDAPKGNLGVQPKLDNGTVTPLVPTNQTKKLKPKDALPPDGTQPKGQMKNNGQSAPDQNVRGKGGKHDKKKTCDPNIETCPPAN